MQDIHKGGRPPKFDTKFYIQIVNDYETNTRNQIAQMYHVSVSTVDKWLRKGREIANGN